MYSVLQVYKRRMGVLQIYTCKQTNIMYSVLQVYKIKMGYCRYTLVNKQILWTLYCRFITEGWVLQIYTSKQTNIMYYVLQVYKSRMGILQIR